MRQVKVAGRSLRIYCAARYREGNREDTQRFTLTSNFKFDNFEKFAQKCWRTLPSRKTSSAIKFEDTRV